MIGSQRDLMLRLRQALEVSWGRDTSYMAAYEQGNPALGQCYPTCRVVQYFYPETEIIKGVVQSGELREDVHFWNGLPHGDGWYHIDLSWQQFPAGSQVLDFSVLDRNNLGDSAATITRVSLLLERVKEHLMERA